MMLKLDRPLIHLDVETHAFVAPRESYICELSFHVDYPDGSEKAWSRLLKPPVAITAEATAKHHITNEMVKDAPTFAQIAPHLAPGFVNCDFCGYYVKFDIEVMDAEFKRTPVEWSYKGAYILDPHRVWQVAEPRTLGDAVKRFLGRESTEAHRAAGDVKDAREVFHAMLEAFPTLPRDLYKLHELQWPRNPNGVDDAGKIVWKDGRAVITFGKHNGKTLQEAVPKDRRYFEWLAGDTSGFPDSTRSVIGDALEGKFPEPIH